MSKIHTARLADRYTIRGVSYVRVRDGSGPTIEVRVPAECIDQAASIYGGGQVSYQYRGGRAVMVSPQVK